MSGEHESAYQVAIDFSDTQGGTRDFFDAGAAAEKEWVLCKIAECAKRVDLKGLPVVALIWDAVLTGDRTGNPESAPKAPWPFPPNNTPNDYGGKPKGQP